MGDLYTPEGADVAETATSRRQKIEIRGQNFKVSPTATISNIEDNVCGMDTPEGAGSVPSAHI